MTYISTVKLKPDDIDHEIKMKRVQDLLSLMSHEHFEVPLTITREIDKVKFNQVPFILAIKEELKKYDINKDWLFENGFDIAGLLLDI